MIYKSHFNIIALLLLFSTSVILAQPTGSPFELHPPLEGELTLSGSVGELRTNGFHAGIDFRTGSKIGQKVFASEHGYISRIRVGGTGFGKAIYINHPNGLTTVYAHLDKFSPEIEQYIKELQYKRKSFAVDTWLTAKQFPVKRGQHIGFSGNTGSSGGPHLHYELRRTKGQIPLNASFSNLPIHDHIKPTLNGIWLYPLNDSDYIHNYNKRIQLNVQQNNGVYGLTDTLKTIGTVGIGIKTYDYINKNSLRCGVYAIKGYVNGKLFYNFCVDQLSYSERRFANSHMDYAYRINEGKRVHKLFKDPNNRFSGYKSVQNNGHLKIETDSTYNITIVVEDSYGLTSTANMVIKGDAAKNITYNESPPKNAHSPIWLFYNDNSCQTDWYSVTIPKNTLYENIRFTHSTLEFVEGAYSPLICIHTPETPLHRAYTLSINADSLPKTLLDKALIASLSSDSLPVSAGGKYTQGVVETQVNYFGNFFVAIDTLAPEIKPINISQLKDMSKENLIGINIEDNLSGIGTYEGYIDGSWVLFEYDPKNNYIFYEFDKQKLEPNTKHNLILTVTDNKNNTSQYSCTFYW